MASAVDGAVPAHGVCRFALGFEPLADRRFDAVDRFGDREGVGVDDEVRRRVHELRVDDVDARFRNRLRTGAVAFETGFDRGCHPDEVHVVERAEPLLPLPLIERPVENPVVVGADDPLVHPLVRASGEVVGVEESEVVAAFGEAVTETRRERRLAHAGRPADDDDHGPVYGGAAQVNRGRHVGN